MMKELRKITKKEIKNICSLLEEPFYSYMTKHHSDIKCEYAWDENDKLLEVEIHTESSNGDNDKFIRIYSTGKVTLSTFIGSWGGGFACEDVNTLPVTDYLRKQGYEFKY